LLTVQQHLLSVASGVGLVVVQSEQLPGGMCPSCPLVYYVDPSFRYGLKSAGRLGLRRETEKRGQHNTTNGQLARPPPTLGHNETDNTPGLVTVQPQTRDPACAALQPQTTIEKN
jgi:hypothetical protein